MKHFIIITLLMLILFSCKKLDDSGFSAGILKDNASQSIANINVNFVDSIFTKAILKADSGLTFANQNITLLKHNVAVQFFSQTSNKRVSLLNADSAIIEDKTNNMTAFGKVVVLADSSFTTLETSKLQWNNKDRLLFSNEYVKITSPKEIIQGYGFESNEKLTYYKIYKVIGEQR